VSPWQGWTEGKRAYKVGDSDATGEVEQLPAFVLRIISKTS
jgi:hypothetical protein